MSSVTAEPASFCSSPRAARQRRAFALLDTGNTTADWAAQWCATAIDMYQEDGNMKEARTLLRGALFYGAHPETIYHAWIDMEAELAGDLSAARMLFEEWRSRAGYLVDDSAFWCHYIAFELDHGTAQLVRGVAEVAVLECPRDPTVYASYAKAELRLGRADNARAVVGRALDVLDEGDGAWLVEEVKRYSGSVRKIRLTIGGLLRSCYCGGIRA